MVKGGFITKGGNAIKDVALPLISVITVVRNGENDIQSCIDTVCAQAYPNIEHIIWDGNSNDATVEILKKNDERIALWISEADNGIYDAMNKAIPYCSGDWYFFLGVDDLLLEGFSRLAANLTDNQTAYYGCVVYQGVERYDGAVDRFRLVRHNIPHQALLYPKVVFETHKYDISYNIAADNVLLFRLWKEQRVRFEYNAILLCIFNHTGISGWDWDRLFFKNRSRLIFDNLGMWPYIYHLYLFFVEKVTKKINKRVTKVKRLFSS